MFDYMSVKETAKKWGLSERRVQILCSNNRIQGVIRINRMWLIPKMHIATSNGRFCGAKRPQCEAERPGFLLI